MKLSEFKEVAFCPIFAQRENIEDALSYAREILGNTVESHTALGVLLNTLVKVLENDDS